MIVVSEIYVEYRQAKWFHEITLLGIITPPPEIIPRRQRKFENWHWPSLTHEAGIFLKVGTNSYSLPSPTGEGYSLGKYLRGSYLHVPSLTDDSWPVGSSWLRRLYCSPVRLYYNCTAVIIIIMLTLCGKCPDLYLYLLSWGQPIWQGLRFSGLVHAETRPCGSNFIQSIFETVQAGCINSVLVQTVPSVNDSIWEKYFLISMLNLTLQIFLLWPRTCKPLSLQSSVNKTLISAV